MRAIQVIREDGPGAIVLAEVPEPRGELVIAVRAAGVSFPDLLMTRGLYQLRQQLPFTLGWESAGEVLHAPAGSAVKPGDRVITMSFGSFAEQVAAVPETTFALPDELSFEEGAALPLNYLTAIAALQRRGGLRAGETVLIHGAAGGVGSATIQVAKALGATVIAAVSSEEKAQTARALGADDVAVGEDFRAQLHAPVDLIIDPVGGQERFTESCARSRPRGASSSSASPPARSRRCASTACCCATSMCAVARSACSRQIRMALRMRPLIWLRWSRVVRSGR